MVLGKTKIRNNKIRLIETTDMSGPATKVVAQFLNACNLNGRNLFLGEGQYVEFFEGDKNHAQSVSVQCEKHDNFMLSLRNIPKNEFSLAKNINGYDILVAHEIILTEPALNELYQWLC